MGRVEFLTANPDSTTILVGTSEVELGDLDDLARENQRRATEVRARQARAASPPPVPRPPGHNVERTWTVHDQGRQFGPHTEVELATLMAVGTISTTALVWRDGSPRWIPITNIVPMPAFPNQPPPPQMGFRQDYRDVRSNRVAAGICGILFGALGVHKFILGFTGAGMTMLLVSIFGGFCYGLGFIVMGVIGFVEGIIYLTKSDAQFQADYGVRRQAWF